MDQRYTDDFYTKDAKRKGYRARSIFKLQEIDEKYLLFRKGAAVLDLGAAPGSFLQYISKKIGKRGIVVGIDLTEIEPLEEKNIHLIHGDINELKGNPSKATSLLPKEKKLFDVVTADLAPKTSGNKELDHYRSMELNQMAFDIARDMLKPGGFIVSKIFEGEETADFVKNISADFKKIKMVRPKASARSRNEVFYVGKRK